MRRPILSGYFPRCREPHLLYSSEFRQLDTPTTSVVSLWETRKTGLPTPSTHQRNLADVRTDSIFGGSRRILTCCSHQPRFLVASALWHVIVGQSSVNRIFSRARAGSNRQLVRTAIRTQHKSHAFTMLRRVSSAQDSSSPEDRVKRGLAKLRRYRRADLEVVNCCPPSWITLALWCMHLKLPLMYTRGSAFSWARHFFCVSTCKRVCFSKLVKKRATVKE